MIRITLLLSFSVLVMTSCSSPKNISEKPRMSNCDQNFKNDFSRIELDETFLTINSKTEKVTEAKFYCLYSFLQTKKIIYDNFGKWDNEISRNQNHHPLLVWNSIPLLNDSNEKFTVITDGEEVYKKETYASISILDENGRDALASSSEYRSQIIDLFSKLIKQTDHQNEEFHKVYLKKVSPKKWEKLYGAKS